MPRRHFLHSWLLALFALAVGACHKSGSSGSGAGAIPAGAPDDVLAVLASPAPEELVARVNEVAAIVRPGAEHPLGPTAAATALAAVVGAPVDGLDLGRPIHILALDPKKYPRPLVLFARVASAARLKRSAEVAVEERGGRALIGAPAAVAAVTEYAFAELGAAGTPSAPTVTMWAARVHDRYRADLEAAGRALEAAAAAGGGGTNVSAILRMEVAGLLLFMAQSERLIVKVDLGAAGVSFDLGVAPRAGTGLDGFVRAQRPMTARLLGKLPPTPAPQVVMAGHTELGPLTPALAAWLAPLFAELRGGPDPDFEAHLGTWLGLLDGEMAAVSWIDEHGTHLYEVLGASDGANARAAMRTLLAGVGAGRPLELMGFRMTLTTKLNAATHDSVSIDTLNASFDFEAFPEVQRAMMKRLYPNGMQMATAGFDQVLALTIGDDAIERMGQLIDQLRHGQASTQPDEVKQAFDAAVAGGQSAFMRMNLAAALTPVDTSPAARSGILMSVRFENGEGHLVVTLPAEHLRELMGVMRAPR